MSTRTDNAPYAVIAGLGSTGLSCARHLRAHGWRLAVTDTRAAPPMLPELTALDARIPVRLGGLDPSLLKDALCVVASPGLALTDAFFVEARRLGLEIVGDIELFARAVDAPVVGITGTNGKSTVTTLLARMAERAALRDSAVERVATGVGHAQSIGALDSQRTVHHIADAAGAAGMVHGDQRFADMRLDRFAPAHLRARRNLPARQRRKRWRRQDRTRDLKTPHQHIEVARCGQEPEIDRGFSAWIAADQRNAAAARRP